jgi:hypothetical protein
MPVSVRSFLRTDTTSGPSPCRRIARAVAKDSPSWASPASAAHCEMLVARFRLLTALDPREWRQRLDHGAHRSFAGTVGSSRDRFEARADLEDRCVGGGADCRARPRRLQ